MVPPGWKGANCDVNINDCVDNPCAATGKCVDKVGMYACDCETGWTGEYILVIALERHYE